MAYKNGLGYMVTATERAHANGDVDTFTVVGGIVLVTHMYGVITVAAGGACNISVGCNPGTGTTVAWCVGADVDTAIVGDLITMNYVAGTLTTVITGVSGNYRFAAQTGTIFVRGDAVQGTSRWTLFYIPITTGAYVVTV